MSETIALALLGGGLTVIVGAYIALRKLPWERRSSEASEAAMLTKAAAELVSDLSTEVARLRDQYIQLEKEHRETTAQLNMLRVDLLSAKERIRRLEQQNAAKDRIIENLRNQVEMLRSTGVEEGAITADLKLKVQALESENKRLKRQIKALQVENKRLKVHLERLEAANEQPG